MYLLKAIRFVVLLQCMLPLADSKWVDLSHKHVNRMLTWGKTKFFNMTVFHNGSWTEHGYNVPYTLHYMMKIHEHTGTHIDAPVHFAFGRPTVDEIPIEKLIGEVIVVNISGKTAKDREYQLSVADLKGWEKKNGRIPDGGILLVLTGWAKYWGNYEKYYGTNSSDSTKYRFPGIHKNASQWLVDNRKINGIGLDSRSLDRGSTLDFPSHRILLGNEIFGLENLVNVDKLPARGSRLYVMPMKIEGGSGGPTRVVANLDEATGSNSGDTKNVAALLLFLILAVTRFNG